MRLLRWLSLVTLLLFLCSCGREVKHIKNPKRDKVYGSVVSLSPSTTEIVGRWGGHMWLRGRTSSCNWPAGVEQLPVMGDVKPYYEKILALEPRADLILFERDLYSEQDMAKLKAAGIDLYAFEADTVDQFVEKLYELGAMLGLEVKFSGYVDKIQQARTYASTEVPKPGPTVAIITGDYIAGKKSLYADIVRCAGGEPIGPDSVKFEKIKAEALVAMNPSVILDANQEAFDRYVEAGVSESDKATRGTLTLVRMIRGSLLSDSRFKSIDAIKNKRVASVKPDVMLRKGGRIDLMITDTANYLASLANHE